MSDEASNSIVSLGDISKPADTLIRKVSKAVGGFFAPYQVKRMAKAEAEAAIIKTQADIEITNLHRRAMHRFIEEEACHQENMESITNQSLPLLSDGSNAEEIEDDWITNFFDKSRIVSDIEMQELWARVLAGEANSPGSYSKRTVNFLGDLDKSDAEIFKRLCGFCWMIGNIVPLVFDVRDSIYDSNGIDFAALTHLESIGLIQFESLGGYRRVNLPKRVAVFYYGQQMELEFIGEDGTNELDTGKTMLTKIGLELAPICNSSPVDGFWDYVRTKWQNHIPKESNEGEHTNV